MTDGANVFYCANEWWTKHYGGIDKHPPGWYFWTESYEIYGPYDHEDVAKNTLCQYVKWLKGNLYYSEAASGD